MCGKVSQENFVELTAAPLFRIAKNGFQGAAITDIEGVSGEIKAYSKHNNSISDTNLNHEYSYNFGENNRIFDTQPVNSDNIINGPGAYDRAVDSESKILEDIAHQLGYTPLTCNIFDPIIFGGSR